MRKHLRRSRRKLLSVPAWRVRLVFWLGAIVVGCICALFAELSELADSAFQSFARENPYLPLVLTPLGLVIIIAITRHFFPGAQGSGIPQSIAALEMVHKSSVLSFRIAIGKVFLTVMGLFSGASIGREGPSVHVGASVMYGLGKFANFPHHYRAKGLILAGSAAGIAAAFNTPLAGIVFAIEEMSKSFEQRTSGIVITAVALAGITALYFHGNYHYFGTSNASLDEFNYWLAVPIAGVIGGLLGGLFTLLLLKLTETIVPFARQHPYYLAATCGLLVALFGLASNYQTSGTGYNTASDILSGTAEFDPWLPLLKIGATISSYLSGIPGGIFAPSLATGAGIGSNLAHWIPIAPISVMILLGMVAYFAGVVQSPITAFVIVMEMTNNNGMLMALMATSLIAHGSSHLVCPRPLYHTLAEVFIRREKMDEANKPIPKSPIDS